MLTTNLRTMANHQRKPVKKGFKAINLCNNKHDALKHLHF